MSKSEYKIINNNKNLIICFGGFLLKMGGILPFEFLNYLSSIYQNECDLVFFIDHKQCWYHKGIQGITSNIDETALYINSIIKDKYYKNIIFMGNSAGGYAAILFGSICNVSHVISFIPQTILENPIDSNYSNLKDIINKTTKYTIYGNTNTNDTLHNISHCENIDCFTNVKLIKTNDVTLKIVKKMRDNGDIKRIIDNIIFS
jgi:predicted esterase YcpF (UPF0227 family)